MTTSQHAFDQVRSILGRLDRSIDKAREKRLHGDDQSDTEANPARKEPAKDIPGRDAGPTTPPPPPVGPPPAAPRAPSPFGRAKPLRKPAGSDAAHKKWTD